MPRVRRNGSGDSGAKLAGLRIEPLFENMTRMSDRHSRASALTCAAALRPRALRLYPPSSELTIRPPRMRVGNLHQPLGDVRVVGFDQPHLAEVVLPVRVEAGGDENHLRLEFV